MKQSNRQFHAKRFISLLIALCMIMMPTAAFAADPVDNNGKLTFTCPSNAVTGGTVFYKINSAEEFTPVTTSNNAYEPITLTDEVTSITIKLQANTNYQLDTVRGVTLKVNDTENKATADDLTALVSDSGYTYNLSALLGGSAVSESSFELEFGFGTDDGGVNPPSPTTNNGELSFSCPSNAVTGGTVFYKINSAEEFIPVTTSNNAYEPITLTDEVTSITIKLQANTNYQLDTVRGVTLKVNDTENKATADDLTALVSDSGFTYNLSTLLGGSAVSESSFELEFGFENQNGGGGDEENRPHKDDYPTGTPVENVQLTITGDIDFCINDSRLVNISNGNAEEQTVDYKYTGDTVDFYVYCFLGTRYTSIKINGTDYYDRLPTPDTDAGKQALLDACKGQLNEFKISVPYSESGYTIEAARKDLDESDAEYLRVGNFLWYYNAEECQNPDDFINHGKIELIQVDYNGTTYLQEDLQNPGTAFDWDDGEGDGVGAAVLPAGAVITAKIVPEYGYQLSLFGVNNATFGTGDEQSVFSFEVARGNFHLCANITEVEDKVENNAESVTDGSIQLGEGEIDTGSIVLSVSDSKASASTFEEQLTGDIENFSIESVLDINLSQVLYKGKTTDFWENPLNDLKSPAEITLDLNGNFENVVVIHQNHDGTFERITTTLENGKITFTTNSFSDFALAVVPAEEKVSEPVILPAERTFTGAVDVTITAEKGAEIHYTTDNSTPTATSPLYDNPFTITSSTTVKAIAIKGSVTSEVATAKFTKKSSGGGGGGGGYRPTSPTTPTDPNPSIGGSAKSWSDVAADLAKLTNGSEVTIQLNGNTTVPVEVIKVIDDRQLKVTFVVDSVKSWKTDGAEITTPAAADFSILATSKLKTDALRGVEGIQFTMNNTNIPTDLTVAFKTAHAGKFANLYKVVDGKQVFVTCAKLGEDGKVILPDVIEKGDYVAMLCEFSDRLGDMSNDGVMNAMDASAILKDIVGLEPGKNPLMADFNGDGNINAMDASAILKRIVGLA